MSDQDIQYKATVIYGIKFLRPVRYRVREVRIGGLPFQYWVESDLMRIGPFGRDEACGWCRKLAA